MKDLSFKNMILNIPESFYSKGAFAVLMMYILSLPLVLFHVAFFWNNLISIFLFTCGAVAQLLIGFYILSRFVRGETSSFKSFFNLHIWDLLLLFLLLWSAISTILADDLELAIMGTFYRSEGFTMYLNYAAIYICGKLVKDSKKRNLLLVSFCLSITLLAMTVYLQTMPSILDSLGNIGKNLSGSGFNTAHRSAVFLNRNHFAYMLTLCLLGFAGVSIYSNGFLYTVSLLMFALNFGALMINDTFGCYLSVLVGLVFLAVLMYFINPKLIKKVLILIFIFVGITIACEFLGIGSVSADFDIINDSDVDMTQIESLDSGHRRLILWKKAIECIFEKPIFGYGPEGLYHIYTDGGFENNRPHNEYLQIAAFHGIPGLCLYLGSLLSLFVYCLKRLKKLPKELLIIGGMIFSYCASAFLGNSMYYTTPYFYLFFGILSGLTSKKLDH